MFSLLDSRLQSSLCQPKPTTQLQITYTTLILIIIHVRVLVDNMLSSELTELTLMKVVDMLKYYHMTNKIHKYLNRLK